MGGMSVFRVKVFAFLCIGLRGVVRGAGLAVQSNVSKDI